MVWPPVNHADISDEVTLLRTTTFAESTLNTPANVAASAFNTVPLDTVVQNGGGSWAGGVWTCPRAGLYLCAARVRLADSSASRSMGVGIHLTNQDGPFFAWRQAGGVMRDTTVYTRVMQLAVNDQPRLFIYSDTQIANLNAASFTLTRLGN